MDKDIGCLDMDFGHLDKDMDMDKVVFDLVEFYLSFYYLEVLCNLALIQYDLAQKDNYLVLLWLRF